MTLEEKRIYVNENLHHVPEREIKDFNFNFACVLTKNSTGMEKNNPISIEDVVSVLKGYPVKCDEGLKVSVYNHYKAYNYLLDHINDTDELTEDFIKDLHEIIVKDLYLGGQYRKVNISINNSNHVPCDHIKVYDRMIKYINQVNEPKDPIENICYTHLQLAKIHPFIDGNGRLARLLLNYALIKHGYLPISIPAKKRNEYFKALEEFKVNKTIVPFKDFLLKLMDKEYDRVVELINRYI